MALDSPSSPLGQLQRGLGRGYLRARKAKDVEALLHCIHNDPRWSPQSDPHAPYYARLAMELEVDVSLISSRLDDESEQNAHNLAVQVLGELGARGVVSALGALRAALRTESWRAALERLNALQPSNERCLVDKSDLDAVLHQAALAELVVDSPAWRRWASIDPQLQSLLPRRSAEPQATKSAAASAPTPDTSMSTSALLELACARNHIRIGNVLAQRTDPESIARLRAAARGEAMPAIVALGVLGRQQDPSLVDHCESRLAATLSARERGALLSYLTQQDPKHTLPLARRQQHQNGFPGTVARRVLSVYAEEQDREALTLQVSALFEEDNMYGVGDACTALGAIGNPTSADVLVDTFESMPCPYVREAVLIAVHKCSLPKSAALAPDALYDCGDGTRRWATIMAKGSPEVDARIAEIAGDEFEWDHIRKIAKERVAF